MAAKMRRVSLLGAFEIQSEADPPLRDGLILGSRREQLGFVIETSRETIEHLVSLVGSPSPGLPRRLTSAIGDTLQELGCELIRVELVPLPIAAEEEKEGYGAYIQGWLAYRPTGQKLRRIALTATEGIQVALREGLPMLADASLLQLDVAQLLQDMNQLQTVQQRETRKFHSFLDKVTATDFERFWEQRREIDDDDAGDGDADAG